VFTVLALVLTLQTVSPPAEVLREIRVQGNILTPEEEVLRLAGVTIGAPVTPEMPAEVAARLKKTDRFEEVQVLKRFASIADPSQISLVIILDEGPVSIDVRPDGTTRVVRKGGLPVQFLPMLDFVDGYGFSYGARVAVPALLGADSRLSFPMTWGGLKQVGAEFDLDRPRGALSALSRLQIGGSLSRRENPYYEEDDDRARAWVRAERAVVPWLRVGGVAGLQQESFAEDTDRFNELGADVVVDTRRDPALPRNAVYGRATWSRLRFADEDAAQRTDLEGRGYLGLFGQSVLAVSVQRQDSNRTLPPYLRPLLGGMATVRGFAAGSEVGDTLVAGSVELRLPITSPLSFGKLGVSAFFDAGAVYDKGEHMADQRFSRGAGGGVWFSAAIVRAYLAVAHGLGGSTRTHFGTTLAF
jgi:outer membrane protein assembly factor BamA